MNGLIELTEDIIVEGYDEYGNAYTFAGATPAEITHLNGVTHSIQARCDDVNNEFNAINTELNYCIKCSINRLKNDVTLNSDHMFCGATSSEINYLSRVSSSIQTQCNNTIKRIRTKPLLGDVSFSGYKFCGASVAEIGHLSGVTSNIQTQWDNAIKMSGTSTLTGDVVKMAHISLLELHQLNEVSLLVYNLN